MSSLVISLDFELMWGVRDRRAIRDYGANIMGVRMAIPAMLALFRKYKVRATWAAVGMLMFRDKKNLLQHLPELRPSYDDPSLSPYNEAYVASLGADEGSDPHHFWASLVERILDVEGMELGSHTFSHYYCLEAGQTEREFAADLRAAVAAAKLWGVRPVSLVFPRNQFNASYLSVCSQAGFRSYRGNETGWIYRASAGGEQSQIRRGVRLLDSYINLTGSNGFEPDIIADQELVDVPASRFLRPYSGALAALENVRLHRLLSAMDSAARRSRSFHLWWHPHNFGACLGENLAFLEAVLRHFETLRHRCGMESRTMAEVANQVLQ